MRTHFAFVLSVSSLAALPALAAACGGSVEQTASAAPEAGRDATTGPTDPPAPLSDAGSADPGNSGVDAGDGAALAPTIATVSPDRPYEGSDITIRGTGFGPTVVVKIRDVQARVVSTSASEVVVTVPDFPVILVGPPVPSTLVLSVPGRGEATYPGFMVRGTEP